MSADATAVRPGGAPTPAAAILEPMRLWHGLWVPDGACGPMVGGRAQVLPCGDARVKAYRAAVARAAARRRRDVALGLAAGAVAAVLLGALAVVGRRRPCRHP